MISSLAKLISETETIKKIENLSRVYDNFDFSF